jgi:hypothetical protein
MIVLHTGMPKTGTSALQHCLALYAKDRPERVLYPVTGRGGAVAHHRLAGALAKNGLSDPLIDQLDVEIAATSGRTVVLSSEGFNNVVAATLFGFVDRLAERDEVRVVIAVRELSSFLESMYLQSTRFGTYKDNFANYIRSRRKWIGDFIAGLAATRDRFGNSFRPHFVGPGFDSLSMLESAAELPLGQLTDYRSRAPDTAKRSLKQQVALLHLDTLNDQLGLTLRPIDLMRVFDAGFEFMRDEDRYTLLTDSIRDEVWTLAAHACERHNVPEYAETFHIRPAKKLPPPACFDFDVLSVADIAAIAAACGR